MALTYYKCVRPDGTDFHTGRIDYAAALETGEIIEHRATMIRDDPSTYLSVSIHPTNCTGMRWPCRLFRIEPVGRTLTADPRWHATTLHPPHAQPVPGTYRVVEITASGLLISHWPLPSHPESEVA